MISTDIAKQLDSTSSQCISSIVTADHLEILNHSMLKLVKVNENFISDINNILGGHYILPEGYSFGEFTSIEYEGNKIDAPKKV
jgi:hypothetical protein